MTKTVKTFAAHSLKHVKRILYISQLQDI